MAVITWPATLRAPAEWTLSQARYDMLENSDATGHQAARLLGPARWRVALRCGDAFTLQQAGVYESMLLRLRGGVNHLQLHDPVRAAPQGTLRGAPVLSATAVAGATSLSLARCTSLQQMLLTPFFEVDTDANGMADDWDVYDSGTAGTVTVGPGAPNGGARAQRITATALDIMETSQAGVTQLVPGIVAGQTYALSVDELSATATSINCTMIWLNTSNAQVGVTYATFSSSISGYTRRQVSGTAPAGATQVRVYLTMHSNAAPGFAAVDFDNAQLEIGGAYTALAAMPTLLAGDWLQLGSGLGTSQLVKVVADVQASNNSRMTVTIEPPLRIQYASNTAVTWDRPTTYFKQLGSPQWSYRPGRRQKQSGFALDLLESWT